MKIYLALLLAVASISMGFSGGSGTYDDPYLVSTVSDIEQIDDNLSSTFLMTSNIDMSGKTYDDAVIGNGNQFSGTFDGDGYEIIGLTIDSDKDDAAFFGQTRGAIIKNLGIVQANIDSKRKDNVAILCGYSFNNTQIENCYVSGTVIGDSYVGGLIGYNQVSSVDGCHSDCIVEADDKRAGGLIGYNFNNSPVSNSSSSGTVEAEEEAGGLIGMNQYSEITNCYSSVNVTASENEIGGFIGYNQGATITDCYATGIVTGKDHTGGLLGYDHGDLVTGCYATGDVFGENYCGGLTGYCVQGDNTESYATGVVTSSGNNQYVGGFVGRNGSGTISYCYATGNVSGYKYNGGFAGYNNSGLITVCSSEGDVYGSNNYSGGFVGTINSGTVSNCYNTGNTAGLNYTGGFCGLSNSGSIKNSYCSSAVSGVGSYVGCFLGVTWSGVVTDCFWNEEVSVISCDDGSIGGYSVTGLTTIEIVNDETFLDAGWDFNSIWKMPESGSPVHEWHYVEIPMLGSGTKNDPYQIATRQHLEQVNYDTSAYYILTADIDLSTTVYNRAVVAPDTDNSSVSFVGDIFLGTFDGNGYEITGLTIDTLGESNSYLGLFGHISRGSVSNVVLTNVSITGGFDSRYIGALAGYNSSTVVTSCSSTGTITIGNDGGYYGGLIGRSGADINDSSSSVALTAGEGSMYVGGFIGYNYMTGKIVDCFADGSVNAAADSESIGGLVGRNWFGAVSDCYASADVQSGLETTYIGCLCGYNAGSVTGSHSAGDITSQGSYVGNLCGYNYYGSIINSFAVGDILSASDYVAGLCPVNFKGVFQHCYAAGAVTGTSNTGGLAVSQTLATIGGCFWDIEATNQASSIAGTGKLTAQMQDMSTYTYAEWDFDNYWSIEAQQYPALVYPNIPIPDSPDKFSGGRGTLGNPYQIDSSDDWVELTVSSEVWDKYFIVTNDIDLTDVDILPVGEGSSFSGVFDGQGYTVSNAVLNSEYDNQGLFAELNGAQILNLLVVDINVSGDDFVGGLCAKAINSQITACSVQGSVVGGNDNVGGIAGAATGGSVITDCYADVQLQGNGQYIGGIAGLNNASDLVSCSSVGHTFGSGSQMGGVVGRNENGGLVSKCYADDSVNGGGTSAYVGGVAGISIDSSIIDSYSTADIEGYNDVGGLIGSSTDSIVTNCYAAGTLATNNEGVVGGLIAEDTGSTVSQCYWDTTVSQVVVSAAGSGFDTSTMLMISTYLTAGWDFADVWWIPTADYPKFRTAMKGSGSQTDPYQIENQHHLELVNDSLYKTYFTLVNDIDLSGTTYSTAVIAADQDSSTAEFVGESFSGVFNGNGFTITGLTIDTSGGSNYYLGLFGRINGGTVRNLKLENVSITVNDNCWFIGGISGWNNSVLLSNCYVTGALTTGSYCESIGGISGENRGTITSCFADMSISIDDASKYAGVICGLNGGSGGGKKGDVTNCYANGSIAGQGSSFKIGGVIGQNWYGTSLDCYAVVDVTGSEYTGGFCGFNYEGQIEDCFWDSESTGVAVSDGGTALTTVEMLDNETFVAVGWDFDNVWIQEDSMNPTLVFEQTLNPADVTPLNVANIENVIFIAQNWLEPVGDSTLDINQETDEELVDMAAFAKLLTTIND